MASASSSSSAAFAVGPLIRNRSTRFLPCRNLHHKWSFKDAGSHSRLSLFNCSNSSPLLPSLPIRHRLLLPHPPLHLLLRSRSPSFRYPLPLMASTVPHEAGPETPQSNPTKTVRVVIKGRVQGVFYRDWTVENATELGLKGWVRNRRDGSVEALFSGRPETVTEMEQRCRRGPPAAMVTGFQVFPSSDDPGPGFERLRTA
ncbi:Acylphosphatase-like protein [Cucumis melo var. makuwa]|uniref:acylphosphatase n=1 Tax=Cucumis melo var. makuwa TaxID=1194695 RepID=A0A5D3C5Z1_CUCMM|nr:Acylphosphatase-like protein [Cucumis melo var. makuwa]TYK07311.1 Acylphosphatase-like protein [Cucumis melo var. makuwa]